MNKKIKMKKISSFIAVLLIISIPAMSQVKSNNTSFINNSTVTPGITSQVNIIGNPVRGSVIVQIKNPHPVQLELSVYNEAGTEKNTMVYNHPGGISTKSINVANDADGLYFLVVNSKSGRKTIQFNVVQ